MNYRAIIQEAWTLTQSNKKLIWVFAFVPALLSLVVSTVYITYQALAFWHSPFIREAAANEASPTIEILNRIMAFATGHPTFGVLFIVLLAIVAVAYLSLPVFAQGALIQLVAHARQGRPVSVAKGISYGFNRFLQLFEYHLFIRTFSIVAVLTEASFALRIFGPGSFSFLGWIFLLVGIIALILTLLFTYSEYFIVLDQEGVFSSVIKSSGLVVRQWNHTLFMLLLMSIIIVRMAINILVTALLPILIFAPIFVFTSLTLAKIGVVVGSVVALVVLYFGSYFFGVFHVFATAVWTFTFMDLRKEDASDQLS